MVNWPHRWTSPYTFAALAMLHNALPLRPTFGPVPFGWCATLCYLCGSVVLWTPPKIGSLFRGASFGGGGLGECLERASEPCKNVSILIGNRFGWNRYGEKR